MGRSFGQKERADLSPRLLDVLLPMIVFARLDEMKFMDGDASLPKYTEVSHIVEHDDVFSQPQQQYLLDLTEASSYALKEFNDREGFGRLKVDALLVPDMPFVRKSVSIRGKSGIETITYTPPVTREEYPITNKEQKLIDLILKARCESKRVLVYHDFVNSGLRESLMETIEKNTGVKVQELKSSITADKREAYLKAMDCDVLITNPELVKTGLDLLEYPTIIFYQQAYSSFNVFTLRQAAKRAWRIGQTVDCEVHSIAYAGTMQHKALKLIGGKMNISQGVEGRLSTGSDIASEAEDENIQIAMARALLRNEKIEASASSSSVTLDLNAREWTEFERFYISHLEAFRANPSEYQALIPVLEIDVPQIIVEVDEEVVVTAVEETEKAMILPAKAVGPSLFVYEEVIRIGKKVAEKICHSVSEAELSVLAREKGPIQLSLF